MSYIRQKGVVLIVVIWIVVLLSVLLLGFSSMLKVERQVTIETTQRIQARASADAVLQYLAALKRIDPELWLSMVGGVYKLSLNKTNIRFRLTPENAFLSFKGASQHDLELLFDYFEATAANKIAEYIVLQRVGTEQGNKNSDAAIFMSADALSSIPEVSAELVDRVRPHLSFDSDHLGVNQKHASKQLLQALHLERSSMQDGELGEVVLYRLQVEMTDEFFQRKIEATVAFDSGVEEYQVKRWNEYNAQFALEQTNEY